MKNLVRLAGIVVALVGVLAIATAVWFAAGGIGARQSPTGLEAAVAHRMRGLLIPRAARDRQNPVPAGAEAVRAGMLHFADHCAVCHANDGSGDTEMGRNLYPRVPDMRAAATQSLSDG